MPRSPRTVAVLLLIAFRFPHADAAVPLPELRVSERSTTCNPQVAWTGTSFVVVWADRSFVYAALVDPAGRVRAARNVSDDGMGRRIAVCPAMAHGTTRSLVTWHEESAVVGAWLSDADLAGARFDIAAGSGRRGAHPEVAFDPAGATFLVVWQSTADADWRRSDVRGRRVHATGALVGPELVIAAAPNAQIKPTVAAGEGLWLVVWEDDRAEAERPRIHGQRVTGDGSLRGDSFRISDTGDASSHWNAAAAYGGSTFLVAWHRGAPTGGGQLLGSFVSGRGEVATPGDLPLSDRRLFAGGERASMTYSASAARFLVAWRPEGHMTVRGSLIAPATGTSSAFEIAAGTRPFPTNAGVAAGASSTALAAYPRAVPLTTAPVYRWMLHGRFVPLP
jgi:hypothetical protein